MTLMIRDQCQIANRSLLYYCYSID